MKKRKNLKNSPHPRFAKNLLRKFKQICPAPRRGAGKRAQKTALRPIRTVHFGIAAAVLFVILFILYFVGFRSPIREDTTFEIGSGASVSSVAAQIKEMLPEARLGEHTRVGTISVLGGFLFMMLLEVVFHPH